MKLSIKGLLESKKAKRILKTVGNILCIASIVFIVYFFIQSDADFSVLLNSKILSATIVLGLLVSLSIIACAFAWKSNLEMFTRKKTNALQVTNVYTRANPSKYIPGNIMHFISRNILGGELGLDQSQMAFSSVIEVLLQIIVAFVFVLLLVSDTLFDSINLAVQNGQIEYHTLVIIFIAIAAIIVAAVIYTIKRSPKFSLRPKNLLLSSLFYLIFCIINSISFIIMLFVLQDSFIGYNILTLGGYYMLAWFLGFITPGAPSGLGIREYMLIVLLSPIMPRDQVLVLMVLMRVITILGDIFAFLIMLSLNKILLKGNANSLFAKTFHSYKSDSANHFRHK